MKKISIFACILLAAVLLCAGCTSDLSSAAAEDQAASGEVAAAAVDSKDGEETVSAENREAPAEVTDVDRYAAVLDHYYEQASIGWPSPNYHGTEISYLFHDFPYYEDAEVSDIGYAFADVNGDGTNELIVNRIIAEDDPSVIYDLFTLVNGEPVHLFSSGERYRFWLCQDQSVGYYGSGGASAYDRIRYTLKEGKLWMREFILVDGDLYGEYRETDTAFYGTDLSDAAYHEALRNGTLVDFVKEHMTEISYAEGDQIEAGWPERQDIDLTPLASWEKNGEEQ